MAKKKELKTLETLETLENNKEVRLIKTRQIIWNEIKADRRAFISLCIFTFIMISVFIGAWIIGTEAALNFDLFNMNHAPNWWQWGPAPRTGGILGTDTAGRDMLQILIVSTRNSIAIGFSVAIIAIIIGVAVGLISGFYGGHIDNVLMRIVDFLIVLPTIMIMVIIRSSVVGFGVGHMILLLAGFGWLARSRLIRSVTFGERVKEYVLASKTLGTPNIVIIIKKVFPNIITVVMADIIITLGISVGIEVGLTAMGVGLPPGIPSLGNLVANALVAINMQQRAWNWLPAILMVFILMLTINYVGQAISRAANAQQRRS